MLLLTTLSCQKKAPSSVLLITVDSLTANDLTKPFMASLVKQSRYFTRAFTPSPVTFPALASIMTGKHPLSHGVLWDYDYVLNDAEVTLAEAFQTHNLRTAAIIGASNLEPGSGLEQGFDSYGYNFDSVKLGLLPVVTVRTASELMGDVAQWVNAFGEKPFFMWVHFADLVNAGVDRDKILTELDNTLPKLLSLLPKGGADTLIILLSTASDSKGAHGEIGHGLFLYDATLKVPLLFWGRGVKAGESDALVSLMDIMPTILSFMSLPLPKGVEGRDLSPILKGGKNPQSEDILLVTMEPYNLWGWAPLCALRTEKYKHIRSSQKELYDLTSDPDENNNLITTQTEISAELDDKLLKMVNEFSGGKEDKSLKALLGPSPDLPTPNSKLGALKLIFEGMEDYENKSYESALAKFEEVLTEDPNNKQLPYLIANALGRLGKTREAIPYLESAAERNPNDVVVLATLGEAYMELGEDTKAVKIFERVISIQPSMPTVYANLGYLYRRLAEGLKGKSRFDTLEKALVYLMVGYSKFGERSARTLFNIGLVSYEMGMEIAPGASIKQSEGETEYTRDDLLENAVRAFTYALEVAPDMVESYFMIGKIRAGVKGKEVEAKEHLKKFIELAPQHPDADSARKMLNQLGE